MTWTTTTLPAGVRMTTAGSSSHHSAAAVTPGTQLVSSNMATAIAKVHNHFFMMIILILTRTGPLRSVFCFSSTAPPGVHGSRRMVTIVLCLYRGGRASKQGQAQGKARCKSAAAVTDRGGRKDVPGASAAVMTQARSGLVCAGPRR